MEKANNKQLLKVTGIIAIGNISTKLVNFFLLPLYTAIISKELYGTIDLVTTIATLLIAAVSLQLHQALFRYLVTVRSDLKKSKIVISTTTVLLLLSSLIYLILFCFASPLLKIQGKWYLLFGVIANNFLYFTTYVARGLGKNVLYAISNFVSASTTIVLNILFLVTWKFPAISMLYAYAIGPSIGGLIIVIRAKLWMYLDKDSIDAKCAKQYLLYALPLVPNELSWWIIHASDRTIVSVFLGVAANGIIAVASKFSAIFMTVFGIFNYAWTEQCVLHYEEEGGKAYICNTFIETTKFFAYVCIGMIGIMPFVFPLLINSHYSEAYVLIPIYLFAVFFNVIIGLISPIYLVHNETKKVAQSTVVAAIINIMIDIVFIKKIGVFAAPVSSLCGYAAIAIWRLIDVNKRYLKFPIQSKMIARILVISIITLIGYYSNQKIFQAIILVAIIIFAIYDNLTILNGLVNMTKEKFKVK